MGIVTAILNGNNYIVTETIGGLITSRLYNLLETTAYLTQEPNSYQTCQLVTDDVPNIAVSDNPGSVYFGNSIFGSTIPSVVFASAKVNCGSSVSSGGGGGGGTATSTSGLQTTGNTSLASIDNKTPALGQALSTASSPVVLTAIQVTALTPPTNTGYALDASVNSLLKPASTLAAVTTLGTITNALPVGANTIGAVNVNGIVPVSLATDADTTSIGTLTAASQTVVLLMGGKSAASVQVSGTWVGTITFEGSVDGVIFNSINAVAASTSQPQPTTTVNGLYRLSPAGLLQIRANMTLFTSGTASISMRASAGTGGVFANQILPSKITDGTNTSAIKPASTAPLATDPALVVTLSPNGSQASSTNQTITNASLASIDSKLPTLGQKLAVGSLPVVIASDNIVTVRTDQTTHGTTDKVAADLTQIAGAPIAVGLGAAAVNSQRIAVANDSRIIPWDGTTPITVKLPSINVLSSDTAKVVACRPLITTQAGQVNPLSDTPLATGVRIRSLLFTNTSGATVFLGVYSSAVALTTASVVLNGYVIRVPAGATLDKGIADFSVNGRLFGANIRIGLSSTLATYTALSAPILALCSLNLELN